MLTEISQLLGKDLGGKVVDFVTRIGRKFSKDFTAYVLN
jgi:hypothetical protein